MAIRGNRPAWDIPLKEIEARAKGMKFDRDYFARTEPQARADSAAAREADNAVFEALAATLPAAEVRDLVLAYSRAAERGESLDLAGFVRADATHTTADGLRMIERINDAGGKIRTFENTTGRKKWMDKYRQPLREMVMLNKHSIPVDQFPEVEARWRHERAVREQTRRDIAAGVDVRFDIETGERVS
jgi:hypothetical protein